jgi:hypothetical protein
VSESDDHDPRPAESGPRFGSAVALFGLGGLLVLVSGGAAAFVLIMGDATEPAIATGAPGVDAVADARPRRMYTRQEFRELVVGKTRAEVAAALGGQKYGVQTGPPEVWHCATVTVDPRTGRPDFDAAVVFERDTATDVLFQVAPAIKGGRG